MFLKGKKCYLGGSIEQDTSGINWRPEPKKVLSEKFGIDVFDPFDDPKEQFLPLLKELREKRDFDGMTKIAKSFLRKDLAQVDRSDFTIHYLKYNVASIGSCHEIIVASNAKKPTIIVSEDKAKIPFWYYGIVPHRFMFGSWDDLYSYLSEVDEGKHKDENRWSFVYGLV